MSTLLDWKITPPRQRWISLWASFPVLRYAVDTVTGAAIEPADTAEALDALDRWALDASIQGSGSGAQAALFILGLWDSRRAWRAGRFDLFKAFNTWDDKQVAAFQSWAASPFRP